jgi:hypothetical protein
MGQLWSALTVVVLTLAASPAFASALRGVVTFNGLPVPGASVTVARDGKTLSAVTDSEGAYVFPDLADGQWTLSIEMFGFTTLHEPILVSPGRAPSHWELSSLPLSEVERHVHASPSGPNLGSQTNPLPTAPQSSNTPESSQQKPEADLTFGSEPGLVVNGSVNNAAESNFSFPGAFGNNRFGGKSLYNGSLGMILGDSALDASPYSLSGQPSPKPSYSRLTGVATFGGPIKIPHLFLNGPFVFAAYQWSRSNNATMQSALMPTDSERSGQFSSPITDPSTGSPFPSNEIPQARISPQAQALLGMYPVPNINGNSRYNYQVPVLDPQHQDALQTRIAQSLGRNDQLFGGFALQSTRSDSTSVFGFLDRTSTLGLNATPTWTHRLSRDWFFTLGYQFSRLATHVSPYFAFQQNISGQAGIEGNDQDPTDWGPPALNFSSGIAGISDAQYASNRNQTNGVSYSMMWNRRTHNVAFGTDFRRLEFNVYSQQDPRGTFAFTGASTGSAFADFLLGLPATASIAYGNPDKYFRQSMFDLYLNDSWQLRAGLTLDMGIRWDYATPITELKDRLANLDVAPGFEEAAPVVASNPTGPVTGETYPASLIDPFRSAVSPRFGIAWRPLAAKSLVLRAGYGIYYDSSIYETLASQLAQQPPISKNLSLQSSPQFPLTLATGLERSGTAQLNTFAVDPHFREGYAQDWTASIQFDLPGALQMTASYLGTKGTHAAQAFLPNTFPVGAANPCPSCPTGFTYVTSGADSTRQAAELQLRRRLHAGLAGALAYTYSKSLDDAAALGGPTSASASGQTGGPQTGIGGEMSQPSQASNATLAIAQNWQDLRGERGLSSFDQRHLLSFQMQYTTGMGIGGGTLLRGLTGGIFKDWTAAERLSVGSGLPQTPIDFVPVPGTGVTGTIRPDLTGASIYDAPAGLFLNPAAYSAPPTGQWGDAGRNSIRGPLQFTFNGSLARTFRLHDRYSLDIRADSANVLNHSTYSSWDTTINSSQFGLPVSANAMRTMQLTVRVRY